MNGFLEWVVFMGTGMVFRIPDWFYGIGSSAYE